jgi:hypothetical protein
MKRIAIHSAPRSGSSWLGQILNSSPKVCFRFQPLFSYAFKDYLNDKSSREDIVGFFENIAKSSDNFLLQKDKLENEEYPLFKKDGNLTHIIYKEVRYHNILENLLAQDKDLKVIGLVRNPFAVISSFLNSPREFRKDLGWLEAEEWNLAEQKNKNKAEEYFGFEKWKEIYFLFTELKRIYPDRFLLVSYDDLIGETVNQVKKIFKFCDMEINEQTYSFIQRSNVSGKETVYSVYRDKKHDISWVNTLDKAIQSVIEVDLQKNGIVEFNNEK